MEKFRSERYLTIVSKTAVALHPALAGDDVRHARHVQMTHWLAKNCGDPPSAQLRCVLKGLRLLTTATKGAGVPILHTLDRERTKKNLPKTLPLQVE
jgi:hypothetical protein